MRRLFQQEILDWYGQHKRDLPWRKTQDPYKILVSEVMLQQTQVDRVIPKYKEFLTAFPTAKDLANAKSGDVLVQWSGLGFNRRALNLQRAARAVVELGAFPLNREGLLRLPGIGPYSAGAILAFSQNKKSEVVDTNIRRIVSRFFFAGGTVQDVDNVAYQIIPEKAARDWNNALMDFGSLVCTSTNPSCSVCPLKKNCTANKHGKQQEFLKIGKPQSKFKGSHREKRGMILKYLKGRPKRTANMADLSKHLGKSIQETRKIVQELEQEGFLKAGNVVSLL